MLRDFVRWLRNSDLFVLVALFLVVFGVWAFLELADEVTDGDVQRFDEWVIQLMCDPQDPRELVGPRWLQELGRDFTALGGVGILTVLSLAVVIFLLSCRKYHEMWLVLITTFGGLVLSSLLKEVIDRPRPGVTHHSFVYTSSFPSGHSMLSAIVYLTLGSLLTQLVASRRLKAYFLGLAMLLTVVVGLSRVYLRVHYPTDVLAGWSMGLAWGILCWLVARYLRERGTIHQINE
jgi:undecaprenyl-diphosphatase